jgi:hypothetical protein
VIGRKINSVFDMAADPFALGRLIYAFVYHRKRWQRQ